MRKDCIGHVLQCKLQFLYYLSLHKTNCFYHHYLSNKIFAQLKNFYLNLSIRTFLMTQIKSGYPIFSSLSLHLLVSSQPNWKWLLLWKNLRCTLPFVTTDINQTFPIETTDGILNQIFDWIHLPTGIFYCFLEMLFFLFIHKHTHTYIYVNLIFLEPRIKIYLCQKYGFIYPDHLKWKFVVDMSEKERIYNNSLLWHCNFLLSPDYKMFQSKVSGSILVIISV